MEQYEIIGFQHKIGEYNGKSYDNHVFSCIRRGDSEKQEVGDIAVLIKVKTSNLNGHIPCVGDTVTPVYDRFGQVVSLS